MPRQLSEYCTFVRYKCAKVWIIRRNSYSHGMQFRSCLIISVLVLKNSGRFESWLYLELVLQFLADSVEENDAQVTSRRLKALDFESCNETPMSRQLSEYYTFVRYKCATVYYIRRNSYSPGMQLRCCPHHKCASAKKLWQIRILTLSWACASVPRRFCWGERKRARSKVGLEGWKRARYREQHVHGLSTTSSSTLYGNKHKVNVWVLV